MPWALDPSSHLNLVFASLLSWHKLRQWAVLLSRAFHFVSMGLPPIPVCFRTRANASMWAAGLGVIETKSRILKGSDVLVVVLNESAAEVDFESSAFVSESREDTDVDVTVR